MLELDVREPSPSPPTIREVMVFSSCGTFGLSMGDEAYYLWGGPLQIVPRIPGFTRRGSGGSMRWMVPGGTSG